VLFIVGVKCDDEMADNETRSRRDLRSPGRGVGFGRWRVKWLEVAGTETIKLATVERFDRSMLTVLLHTALLLYNSHLYNIMTGLINVL
jgi:chloramphenicol 3-O-phosphotransferase